MASRNLGSLTVDLLLKMGGFKQGMDAAARETDRATSKIRKTVNRATSDFKRMAAQLTAGFLSVQTVRSLIRVNDQYTQLSGRLALVTKSAGELAKVQGQLFGVAQRTRTEYAGVADLYIKLAQTGEDLGASQADLVKFTEAVGNALTVSGASAQQAQGALLQLSQGLAGGVFRAEEFNSVLEGAPEIIRTVARNMEGMGGSIGKLRTAVKEGRVTSEAFFRAFLAGSDSLKSQAQSLPVTVGQAMTRLGNSIKKAVGDADMRPLSAAINELAETVTDKSFQEGLAVLVSLLAKLAGLSFEGLKDGGLALRSFGFAADALQLDFDKIEALRFSIEQLKRAAGQPVSVRVRMVGLVGANEDVLAATTRRLERQLAEAEAIRASMLGLGGGPSSRRRAPSEESGRSPQGDLIDAEKLFEKTRTAAEEYDAQILKLAKSLQAGAISQDLYNRGVKLANEELAKASKVDPMKGLSEAQVYARPIFDFANARNEALAAFSAESAENLRSTMQDFTNETTKMLGTMTVETEQAVSAWAAFAEQGARNIQDSFAQFLFDPFSDGLNGMVRGFVDSIRQMLAQYLAFQAITGLGGALSNSENPFLSSIGGFLKGTRAMGGPVTAGNWLVGENGPEILSIPGSGYVTPNHALGGVSVNYTIDARGADGDRIMSIMPGLLRQSEQRTVAQVQQLIQRGRLA